MRKPLISGNWKMNLNHFEALATVEKIAYLLPKDTYEAVDVSVHPPFTDLRTVQTVIAGDALPIRLGAQNCHWEPSGAFTGEISPAFLAKLNCAYVICGHSERRQLFGETDEVVARKVAAVIAHQMTPIMCVGETLEERQAGQTDDIVLSQLSAGLDGRSAAEVSALVIAYEPIWAIGTGQTATADDAQAVCAAIRRRISDTWGAEAAAAVRIQYGGSVKAGNVADLMALPDIDGALVGGASLDADEFARLVIGATGA